MLRTTKMSGRWLLGAAAAMSALLGCGDDSATPSGGSGGSGGGAGGAPTTTSTNEGGTGGGLIVTTSTNAGGGDVGGGNTTSTNVGGGNVGGGNVGGGNVGGGNVGGGNVGGGDPCGDTDGVLCDGICTNNQTDNANCGGCGNVCDDGETCVGGDCVVSCGGGTELCGGACVVTANDPGNCGECGNECAEGEVCSVGQCGVTCLGGTELCGDLCIDTDNDPGNCGECDNTCAEGEVCSVGQCGVTCLGGSTLCEDLCVDTQNDPANCGDCGEVCAAGEVCSQGDCGLLCSGGTELCGDACVVTDNDPANCGDCGTVCAGGTNATAVCLLGDCDFVCGDNFDDCDGIAGTGCEASLLDDEDNCGGCNIECGAGEDCTAGECVYLGIEQYYGSSITTPLGFADFTDVPESTLPFTEGGMQFWIFGQLNYRYAGCGGDGVGYYPSSGGNNPTQIIRTDGSDFSAVELTAADGWSQCFNYGIVQAFDDGNLLETFFVEGPASTTVYGFRGRFDELRVAYFQTAAARDVGDINGFSAGVIDNVTFESE